MSGIELIESKLNCLQANSIDLVSYLEKLGITAPKPRGSNYWYLSPLREEKTASFKIDRKRNFWYDFGLQQGGTLIDFGIRYHRCNVQEFLDILANSNFPFHQQSIPIIETKEPDECKILITTVSPLSSPVLLSYFEQRKIDVSIASIYCHQINYQVNRRHWYGIGFKNDSGGFEIRNPLHKYSSSPKAITSFIAGNSTVLVFEGFMDFLTWICINNHDQNFKTDFVILNGIGFFEQSRSLIESYPDIWLFLDRDNAGRAQTAYALSISPAYKDKSSFYKDYKDLNAWASNSGSS